MGRKQLGSSPRATHRVRNARPIPDREIDFSDVPNSSDAELKRARRVGRPPTGHAKQLIAVRIAPKLLADLRKLAKKRGQPYQTLMHQLLEKAVRREVA